MSSQTATPAITTESDPIAAKRVAAIAGLRLLADFFEQHPGVELPWTMGGAVFADLGDARAMMAAAPGGWAKDGSDDYWTYSKSFGGNVHYNVYVARAELCQRVQVGTKTVEAVAEHEVPIYAWQCAPVDEVDVPDGGS